MGRLHIILVALFLFSSMDSFGKCACRKAKQHYCAAPVIEVSGGPEVACSGGTVVVSGSLCSLCLKEVDNACKCPDLYDKDCADMTCVESDKDVLNLTYRINCKRVGGVCTVVRQSTGRALGTTVGNKAITCVAAVASTP